MAASHLLQGNIDINVNEDLGQDSLLRRVVFGQSPEQIEKTDLITVSPDYSSLIPRSTM